MFSTIRNAFRIPELRKKILFTLFILFVFRLGAAIPVPFIDQQALSAFFQGAENTGLGLLNLFSGGGLSQASIFAMSITPFINASIIMQLLTVAIPALERMVKDGGENGRKKMSAITRYVAIAIGIVQGISYYTLLRSQQLITNNGTWEAVVIVITLTAGTAFIMWLGEQVSDKGIGNGTSIILFAGIISTAPQTVYKAIETFRLGTVSPLILIALVILALALVVLVVFMNDAERRLPVQYAKRMVGRKMYGGQSTHLPIKVSASGVMPIIFASSILSLPQTIGLFLQNTEGSFMKTFVDFFVQTNPVYIIIYSVLILGFSYFYNSIQFNPIEIANNLKQNGGFILGFRPGRPTAEFLLKVLGKITFMGALFLGVVAITPLIIGAVNKNLAGIGLGGTSLLIIVGVALETVKQMEAQMMMRHHKGFLE